MILCDCRWSMNHSSISYSPSSCSKMSSTTPDMASCCRWVFMCEFPSGVVVHYVSQGRHQAFTYLVWVNQLDSVSEATHWLWQCHFVCVHLASMGSVALSSNANETELKCWQNKNKIALYLGYLLRGTCTSPASFASPTSQVMATWLTLLIFYLPDVPLWEAARYFPSPSRI